MLPYHLTEIPANCGLEFYWPPGILPFRDAHKAQGNCPPRVRGFHGIKLLKPAKGPREILRNLNSCQFPAI